MLDISKSQLIGILKASQRVPLNTLEHIDKFILDDTQDNIEKMLTSKKILDPNTIENLEIFLKSLKKNFNKTKKLKTKENEEISQRLLSDELRKDILFSCKIISQKLCTMELVNKSFLEQSQIKRNQKKTLSIGQIMVKNRYIPVDSFIQNFRKIEQDFKKIGWEKLFNKEEKIKITFQNGVVKLAEEEISKNLGNYIIKEEVARGGMGIVYKAWDPKLKRMVALKILKAWEDPPYEEIERFQREAQLVARLNHPNIVNIYDAGEIEDIHGGVVKKVHYFTMDYIEGSALSDYIKENKLKVREKLNIIREIALALEYAHSKGVIHRDIKPGNIIINKSKQALLTDFGLAKGMSGVDSHHLTKSGETIGTPAYMSPEQARGDKEINKLSDIYSLGAVLYESITGSTPFGNYSIGELFQAVINEEPVNPLKLKPGLHPDIVTICLKAMNKKKEFRYSSSKEMADDIDRYLYGEEIKAKKSSLVKRGLKRITRNACSTLTFFCILILIAGIVSFFLKDHIKKNFAQTDYFKGLDYLNYNDYHDAFISFNKALGRSSITANIIRKLAVHSKQRNSKAMDFLAAYEAQRKVLEKDYDKELKIFNKAPTLTKKLRLMAVLEDNKNKQYKNSLNLKKAFQNYWRSFICSPFNRQSVLGILKIFDIIKKLNCK